MIRIPIHQVPGRSCKAKGRAKALVVAHAMVDDERASLAGHFWTLSTGYAVRFERGHRIFMHHEMIGRIKGLDVSHENANKLDNRRANLRHVSRSENMRNPADGPTAALHSNPYRGVTRDDASRRLSRPWRGKVTVNGKAYQTRRYATPEEARDALSDLRRSLHVRVQEFPGRRDGK